MQDMLVWGRDQIFTLHVLVPLYYEQSHTTLDHLSPHLHATYLSFPHRTPIDPSALLPTQPEANLTPNPINALKRRKRLN